MKWQEQTIAHARRNAQGEYSLIIWSSTQTEQGAAVKTSHSPLLEDCPPTVAMAIDDPNDVVSAKDIINNIGKEFNLNEKQWISFRIIARSFVRRYVDGIEPDADPLHMLMTGPGALEKHMLLRLSKRSWIIMVCT